MIYKFEDLIPEIRCGKFLKFSHVNGQPLIVDYTRLDKELVPISNDTLEIKEKKERKVITSISDFKAKVETIVLHTIKTSMSHTMSPLVEKDIQFVVNQIIVDILFNMYIISSKKLTLRQYCIEICSTLGTTTKLDIDAIRKKMERALVCESKLYDDKNYRIRLRRLGRNPNNEKERIIALNKPFKKEIKRYKIEWDYFYYNYNSKLITSKQYKRNFSRDKNNNTPYKSFLLDLIAYDDYAIKILPTNSDSDKNYFEKSMNYYYLESYKRFDYMYNIALNLDDMDFSTLNQNHFLVKRFHPYILYPKVNERAETNPEIKPIDCAVKHKYYAPLLIFEHERLKNLMWLNDEEVCYLHTNKIITLQTIRAISYELFIYHFEFVPSGYDKIVDFIRKCYPIADFYDSNKIWNVLKNVEWNNIDSDLKKKIKILINRMEHINDALFGESTVRKRPSRDKS